MNELNMRRDGMLIYEQVNRKGVVLTPSSLTIPLNVSIHPLQGTNIKAVAKSKTTWCNYSSFIGTVILVRILKLVDTMANHLISFTLLALCIVDYFKSTHFSIEQITIISFVVVLVIVPYSQKLKFFGIEFVHTGENKKKKVAKNDKRTNRSCKKEDR